MSLPIVAVPTYSMVIPSSGQKIKYRPFLVKEEKVLMMAMHGEDPTEMAGALTQIVENCCLDDINIDDLSPFDLEYFFLQLRIKSVGDMVQLSNKCTIVPKGKKKACGKEYELEVDINKIVIDENPDHTNKIDITDKIGVMMRYPDVEYLVTSQITDDDLAAVVELIIHCMDSIYDEKEVYKMKDTPIEETREFIEGLDSEQFKKLRDFFETMPRVVYKSSEVCPKCKGKNEVRIEGLSNFFG